MTRQRKYPQWPGSEKKEVPYDTEHFKMWCVDEENMSEQSARIYVSRIRSAFEIVFKGDYSIFELLAQAFRGYSTHPEICLKNLEMVSGYLGKLIELMSLLPADEFFESRGLKYTSKTISEWASAFSTYHRYYEWRIDKLRLKLGLPPESCDSRRDRMIPLKKEYCAYLKNECRYAPASVWSHVTYLTKLKYFFLDYLFEDDVFDILLADNDDMNSALPIFVDLIGLVDLEIEMAEKDIADRKSITLSVSDLKRGKKALCKYHDFIRDRIKASQDSAQHINV